MEKYCFKTLKIQHYSPLSVAHQGLFLSVERTYCCPLWPLREKQQLHQPSSTNGCVPPSSLWGQQRAHYSLVQQNKVMKTQHFKRNWDKSCKAEIHSLSECLFSFYKVKNFLDDEKLVVLVKNIWSTSPPPSKSTDAFLWGNRGLITVVETVPREAKKQLFLALNYTLYTHQQFNSVETKSSTVAR